MKRKKVAVVLSSGGACGLAHIGVLTMLEKFKVPIDIVVGSSMGALVGGVYCAGKLKQFRNQILTADKKKIYNLFITKPNSLGMIGHEKIEYFLYNLVRNKRIEGLDKKYACVTLDLISGKEMIIEKGNLLNAILASISMPAIFVPIKKNHSNFLVDSGLFDPLPIKLAKDMGAEKIIAVNMTHEETMNSKKTPNVFQTVLRLIHLSEFRSAKLQLEKADVVIEPKSNISGTAYHQGEKAIMDGERAALLAMPQIKKELKLKF